MLYTFKIKQTRFEEYKRITNWNVHFNLVFDNNAIKDYSYNLIIKSYWLIMIA
ncbi:hypothetical protein HanXRQr2_Chr03g0116601 [Helianthus annuus]|uniref:Uncharacterized protein n=1 Tax=Helianthus annuus TaxID=4232 RepID=A0A9K3JGT9_HELAN|nr:hypothetical protein HanXRQr2_Chr03g0116601 [Helianthus annuus]KAJ0944153.1 hypothetical protein HanPSC8_Chr03g0112991 [Helianthus annuus]